MSKCDIRSEFDCQNGISKVNMRCLAQIRMSKYDFEFQNAIFGPNSNIMLTCPCNEYPLTPHFYIVKLGFTFFLIFALKHRLWVLVKTVLLSRF